MPNKQKMQNYDYFDILDFKDRSDRDPKKIWIAIAIRSRTPTLNKTWQIVSRKYGS